MSFEYIRRTYGVPAKHMARVEYSGSGDPVLGRITSAQGARLMIKMDGDICQSGPYHPTWKIRYLDDDTALREVVANYDEIPF